MSLRRRPVNSFWIEEIDDGIYLYLDPKPTASTSTKLSGDCTIAGSVITDATAPFGSINSLIDYPVVVNNVVFRIVSNTASALTVVGTPTDTEITYIIYEKGLEIHYTKTVDALASDTDTFNGTTLDATLICLMVAKALLLMKYKGDIKTVNLNGINELIMLTMSAINTRKKSIRSSSKFLTPMVLRSNHSGRS